jgi:hypothetical protein
LIGELVGELLDLRNGDNSGTEKKRKVRRCKPLPEDW